MQRNGHCYVHWAKLRDDAFAEVSRTGLRHQHVALRSFSDRTTPQSEDCAILYTEAPCCSNQQTGQALSLCK